MRRGLLAPVLLALVSAACQAAPSTPFAPSAAAVPDPAGEAQLALAQRDWPAAARWLREALRRDPESLALRYRLAICATHFDAHHEAAREFRWILDHAVAGSEEATVARSWLAAMEAAAPDAGTDEPDGDKVVAAVVAEPGAAAVAGTVLAGQPGRPGHARDRQIVLLQGLPGKATAGLFYRARTDEHGRYEFTRLVPGPYKLTDVLAGKPTWRVKVVVDPARPTIQDLTPDNTVELRDDFPASEG
jgi:hypothetical protein